MTVHLLKNNFTRGEFSPKAQSRIDLEMYGAGAETLRNFVAEATGGIRRRSGTRYAGQAKTNTNQRFMEFVFSTTGDAYVIELGNLYARFWHSSGGQLVIVGVPVELVTPYLSTDVDDIQFAQIGDTIYMAHPSYAPRKIVRLTNTSWQITTLAFIDGPYLPTNDTSNSIVSSAAYNVGASVNLSFTNTNNINGGTGFTVSDIGRWIRVWPTGSGARWISGTITAVGSTTTITVALVRVGDGIAAGDANVVAAGGLFGSATSSWRLGAFSISQGYPACVEMFEGRLVWARTAAAPRTLWFSRTGLPLEYAPSQGDNTVVSDHSFSPEILAPKMDRVLWLKDAPRLQIGTSAGIRTIGGSDTGTAFSPTNVSQRLEVNVGVTTVVPASAGYASIAVGRSGRVLHNLYFDFNINGLTAPVFTRLSEHLFSSSIKKVAHAQSPEPILWVLNTDGTLVGITFDMEEKIIGFHRHDFGPGALVKSIAVIPNSTRDMLWLLMERVINGVTVHYVEYMEAQFDVNTGVLADAFFVDCGLSYSGAPTNTVSGLAHLASQAVDVLADGSVKKNLTVSVGGMVTLPNGQTASKVHVGLKMTSEARTLRPPYQQDDGPMLGRKQTVAMALIDMLRSSGLRVGSGPNSNQEPEHRRTDQPFGTPPDMKSGTFAVPVEDRWSGGQVYMVADQPLPAFVRSLVVRLDTEHS